MEIKKAQETVKDFDVKRGWGDSWDIKDLSLILCEEVGELWSLIKWVDVPLQKRAVSENFEEASDFIGDSLFLILKIANQMGVDVEKSFNNTMEDYYRRFPPEKIKQVGHGNRLVGGHDGK